MIRPAGGDDIHQEIDVHLQETVDALVASGLDPAATRAEAERRFGDRRHHAARIWAAHSRAVAVRARLAALQTEVTTELRFAIRSLLRAPGYTFTVVATLALAIGANLAVFGIMDGLIFRPLAYLRAPEQVHRVYWQWTDNGQRQTVSSTQYTRVVDLAGDARTLENVAAFAALNLPVGDGDRVQQRPVAAVSASYFRLFDARPARGRFFSESEDRIPRGADVAVLGYEYWRATFGDRNVVGEVLRIGNMRATIVGVAPKGFNGLYDGRPPVAFVPITTYAASTGTGDSATYFSAYKWGWVQVLVRRADGIDLATASAEATRIFQATWPAYAADNPNVPSVDTAEPRVLLSGLRAGAGPAAGRAPRTALWLFGLACAVLLIGCANVAHLSMSRSLARRRDVRVRLALGIGTRRLLIGTCAETLILAVAGGGAAFAIAGWTRLVLSPVLQPLLLVEVSPLDDLRAMVALVVAVVLGAIVMGAPPSILLRRQALIATQGAPRGTTADGGRTRLLLLATQVMLSVILLIGAGLFVRSLHAAQSTSLGYDPRRVLIVTRQIPPGGFDALQQATIRARLLDVAAGLPDVESAAWVSSAPFVSTSDTQVYLSDSPDASAAGRFTYQATTTGYFQTMGTRILRGRGLLTTDTVGAPAVAVVSETMARLLWPARDALGQCFHARTPDSPCREVVGIAEDVVQKDLSDDPGLHFYLPIEQYPRTFGNGLLLRLRDDPGRTGERLRAALQHELPAGYYLVAQPLSDVMADQHASWRMGAVILVAFASLAVVVAAVGVFASVRYDIAQRSREWAVRVALGAGRQAIVGLIIRRSLVPVIAGAVPGALVAAAFSRWIQPLLYQTPARNPVLFALAAALMVLVSIAASTWPALIAARSDPNQVLRAD